MDEKGRGDLTFVSVSSVGKEDEGEEEEVFLLKTELTKAIQEVKKSRTRNRRKKAKVIRYMLDFLEDAWPQACLEPSDELRAAMLSCSYEVSELLMELVSLMLPFLEKESLTEGVKEEIRRLAKLFDAFALHMRKLTSTLDLMQLTAPLLTRLISTISGSDGWRYCDIISSSVLYFLVEWSMVGEGDMTKDVEEAMSFLEWCEGIAPYIDQLERNVMNCGDFGCQAFLIVVILHWIIWASPESIEMYRGTAFSVLDSETKSLLFQTEDDEGRNVDQTARHFLNRLNSLPRAGHTIVSAVCSYFFAGDVELSMPKTCTQFWIDFSVTSKRIHCEFSASQNPWNVLNIGFEDVESVCVSWTNKDDEGNRALFEDSNNVTQQMSAGQTQLCLHLVMKDSIDKVCPDLVELQEQEITSLYIIFMDMSSAMDVEKALQLISYPTHMAINDTTSNCRKAMSLLETSQARSRAMSRGKDTSSIMEIPATPASSKSGVMRRKGKIPATPGPGGVKRTRAGTPATKRFRPDVSAASVIIEEEDEREKEKEKPRSATPYRTKARVATPMPHHRQPSVSPPEEEEDASIPPIIPTTPINPRRPHSSTPSHKLSYVASPETSPIPVPDKENDPVFTKVFTPCRPIETVRRVETPGNYYVECSDDEDEESMDQSSSRFIRNEDLFTYDEEELQRRLLDRTAESTKEDPLPRSVRMKLGKIEKQRLKKTIWGNDTMIIEEEQEKEDEVVSSPIEVMEQEKDFERSLSPALVHNEQSHTPTPPHHQPRKLWLDSDIQLQSDLDRTRPPGSSTKKKSTPQEDRKRGRAEYRKVPLLKEPSAPIEKGRKAAVSHPGFGVSPLVPPEFRRSMRAVGKIPCYLNWPDDDDFLQEDSTNIDPYDITTTREFQLEKELKTYKRKRKPRTRKRKTPIPLPEAGPDKDDEVLDKLLKEIDEKKKVAPRERKKRAPTPRKKQAPAPRKKPAPAPRKKQAPAPRKKPAPSPRKKPAPAPRKKPAPAPTKKKQVRPKSPSPQRSPSPSPSSSPELLSAPAPRKRKQVRPKSPSPQRSPSSSPELLPAPAPRKKKQVRPKSPSPELLPAPVPRKKKQVRPKSPSPQRSPSPCPSSSPELLPSPPPPTTDTLPSPDTRLDETFDWANYKRALSIPGFTDETDQSFDWDNLESQLDLD